MSKKIRGSLLVLFAMIFLAKIALPLAHGQDEDTAPPQGQQTIADDAPAAAPAPYTTDEDPGVQAEPIDDEQDF